MSTDVNLLSKGLIRLGILVFLFIISPVTLTMGFKALRKFENTPKQFLSYIILLIAAILIIFTIYFAFKTFQILLKSLFNN